ncbi:shikimate dehydrogenase [Silanimonas sp.]|jgi:shikimate dehydrogenase|uniref:shikimate dehydrogenase n=1 Tax=Silanimonas sp. TaxID=1929290 RepID=UPI0037C87403
MSGRYALVGQPVAHSLSPRIHAAFGAQCSIAVEYGLIDVAPHGFDAAVAAFAKAGGAGLNVTLPHKEAARALCATLSERARRCGAVNTLIRGSNGWHGDNTDGAGLVHDLTERHRLDLRARKVLLLGAGGAAHGVAPALLDAGIESLWIVNRSPDRADALSDRLGEPGRVHTRYWDDLPNLGVFDMIVNATSAGRSASAMALPSSLATERTLAVDLSYGEAAIAFLSWARSQDCETALDGLGMLVEQAAEAFRLWHGQTPDTDPIYSELRAGAVALHTAE